MTITKTTVTVEDAHWTDLCHIDPYRRSTCTEAAVQLWIDPEERRCVLATYSPGQGIPVEEYHQRVITVPVSVDTSYNSGAVDAAATIAWLRGDEGQALLQRICAGHDIEWNGHDRVGTLDADGTDALEDLSDWLADAPCLEGHGLWDAADWIEASVLSQKEGLTAQTTDAEMDALCTRLTDEARAEGILLHGLEEHVARVRAELIEAE